LVTSLWASANQSFAKSALTIAVANVSAPARISVFSVACHSIGEEPKSIDIVLLINTAPRQRTPLRSLFMWARSSPRSISTGNRHMKNARAARPAQFSRRPPYASFSACPLRGRAALAGLYLMSDDHSEIVKMASLIIALLSGFAGVTSTLCLLKGTATIPWEMQSWSGQSDPEKAFRTRGRRYLLAGLATLALAFVLSAMAAVLSYFS